MNHLEQALQIIKDYPDKAHFVGARSQEQIEKAEAFLGIQFPPSYQAFIRQLGAGSFAGEEFYGITNDDFEHSTVPNAIWLTFVERKESKLPSHLISIYSYGEGTLCCIDVSQKSKDGECPIVAWTPEWLTSNKKLEVLASSFEQFFLEAIEQAKIDLDNEL